MRGLSFIVVLFFVVSGCSPERSIDFDGGLPPSQETDAGRPDGGRRDAGQPDTTAGAPCQDDSQCSGIAQGADCLTAAEASSLGFSAPSGYCTSVWCDPSEEVESQCGAGSRCGPLLGVGTLCVHACHATSECRTGYTCVKGACLPVFRQLPLEPPSTDGGVPSCGHLGGPCCPQNSCYSGGVCIGGQCETCNKSVCGASCVDTTLDHDNCGGCGWKCGANSACIQSQCVVSSCTDGKTLCHTSSGNVCIDTSSDRDNCGGCGQECRSVTANVQCESGSCRILSCLEGYNNCDGDPFNGCETSGQCEDGTYDWCEYPNTCTHGNWCMHNNLTGNHACMRPCGSTSDCPQDQWCSPRTSNNETLCAFACSHGCPSNTRCLNGYCVP